MAQQEILLELHCIDATGMPRDAIYRLESLLADEVRVTIFSAALMLTFDAFDGAPTHDSLIATQTQIESAVESGAELRRSWLDRRDELQALVSQAQAWRDSVSTAVLVQGHWRSVAWTGRLGDIVPVALKAVQAVALKADTESARRIAGWPVPAPAAPAPAPAPEVQTESVDVPLDESIARAKAKAANAQLAKAKPLSSPEIQKIEADAKAGKQVSVTELAKELSNEQKVQRLVAGGMDLNKARKLVRSGSA